VLDHTIAGGTVASVKVNGTEMPELGLNALIAGYYNVPVVFIAGDKAVCDQAKEILGENVVTVAVKEGIGKRAAKTMPLKKAHETIRRQVKTAIETRKQMQVYKLNAPYRFELSYFRSSQAELPANVPGVKRLTSKTIQFESNDFVAGFKLLRALIALGRDDG
jgi:D-amino peptidase